MIQNVYVYFLCSKCQNDCPDITLQMEIFPIRLSWLHNDVNVPSFEDDANLTWNIFCPMAYVSL